VVIQTSFIRSEGMVGVDVIDDGEGVPRKYRKQIFEPFFTTKLQGTGLGLSICRLIVEQHKGRIALTSAGQITTKGKKGVKRG